MGGSSTWQTSWSCWSCKLERQPSSKATLPTDSASCCQASARFVCVLDVCGWCVSCFTCANSCLSIQAGGQGDHGTADQQVSHRPPQLDTDSGTAQRTALSTVHQRDAITQTKHPCGSHTSGLCALLLAFQTQNKVVVDVLPCIQPGEVFGEVRAGNVPGSC